MSDFWYWDKSRVISLTIACSYVVLALFSGREYSWLIVLSFVILPLACIWFGDELGGFTGWAKVALVRTTPGAFIRFIGWVLLLMPVIMGIILSFSK